MPTSTASERRPGPARLRGVVASVLLLAVAGCSSEVSIEDRDVDPGTAAACRELLDDLPGTLAGEERTSVDPDDALGAAWGEDPALVLECGTTMPASFDDLAACTIADGAQWFVPDDEAMQDLRADITVWSLGYEPIVSVLVPGEHRQQSDVVLKDLARPVTDGLELVKPCS